ncbi:MAG: alpha/beta hydrolase family esterase [Bradymonadia bacterium]
MRASREGALLAAVCLMLGCTETSSTAESGVDLGGLGGGGNADGMQSDAVLPDARPADATLPSDAGETPADMGVSVPADMEVVDPPDASGSADAEVEELPDAAGPMGDGCGAPPGANDQVWDLNHDGRPRQFKVHLPPDYDPAVRTPVVINFHGRALNAEAQVGVSGMNDVADEGGFIAVHPEGTGEREQTWNGGLCCGDSARDDVDDVGFTAAMLDQLERSLCIDTRRVYATGISNGGFMSHRLACELSDRIAAIAPVAGTIVTLSCNPGRPVPVFQFHGDDDRIVPYDGFVGVASVESTTDGWLDRNGCMGGSEIFFEADDVRCEAWSQCRDGAEVRLCTILGGGHTWPGGERLGIFGYTTQTISASQMMWDFFTEHALPE